MKALPILNTAPNGVTLHRVCGGNRKVTIATHLNKEDFDNAITGDFVINPTTGRCFVWAGRQFKQARENSTNALRSWMKDTHPTIHDTIEWKAT